MRKLSILLFMVFTINSCKKKEANTSPMMTWNYKGANYSSANPYAETDNVMYHRILGETNGLNSLMLITTSFSAGSYQADSADTLNGAYVTYVKTVDTVLIIPTQSGSITISQSANSKISGTFNLTSAEGHPLTGSFQDVPIQ